MTPAEIVAYGSLAAHLCLAFLGLLILYELRQVVVLLTFHGSNAEPEEVTPQDRGC